MPFKNRIRLPFYVTRAQFPSEQNVFRRADGSTKTLSAIVRKVYEGETNYLPEAIHERLKIALMHDDVTVEGQRYLGGVSVEGDYDIEWNEFLDYPIAKAKFKVQVTPFNYSNDNCQTCEEALQLILEDDTITGPYEALEESQQYEYNVFENDSICCSPVTSEIVSINSLYVASASIDATTGIVTLTMQDTMPSATLVNLLTYRVICPNGGYDDADVFANVEGSEMTCNIPTNIVIAPSETEAEISWDNILGATGYNWQLYLASDLFNPINSGSTAFNTTTLTGLSSGTEYVFYVQTDCGDGNLSGFSNMPFETSGSPSQGCGQYQLYNNNPPATYATTTYIDCNGDSKNRQVQGSHSTIICALENEPGEPVSIFSNGPIDVTYLGPC